MGKPIKPHIDMHNERHKRIFDFLDAHRSGVLASVTPDGKPHAAVIYHVTDPEDFSISFLTKTSTKKYDNLTHDDDTILIIYDPVAQTVAQVSGKARLINDRDMINDIARDVLKAGMESSGKTSLPVARLEDGEYAAFRIMPDYIRMAYYAKPDNGDHGRIFESVESFELKAED